MQRLLIISMTAILLGGCAPWVKTEYSASADFAALKSFAWQVPQNEELENPILDSPLMGDKVKSAVISSLTLRGYQQRRPEQADFLVTYHTVRQMEEVPGGLHSGFGFYYGPWWGGYRAPFGGTVIITNDHDTYEAGVLIIDIINARNGELLWRGWRSKSLNQDNFSAEGVAEIVTEILAQFPPGYDPKTGTVTKPDSPNEMDKTAMPTDTV